MSHAVTPSSSGMTPKRAAGIVLVLIVMALLFGQLYRTAKRTTIDEVRFHARGVAIATAAAIDYRDLAAIQTVSDAQTDSFRKVQQLLDRVADKNPDVRYIYTMRRSAREGAAATDYEYVVDGAAKDDNQNGAIDPDEISEPIGEPYDATDLPELVNAWHNPSADREISPDPPYPDLLSGYAPIRDDKGETVAIVGVDITADTISAKLFSLKVVIVVVALVMGLLITLVMYLYSKQEATLQENARLGGKLTEKYDQLRGALKLKEDMCNMIVHDMRNHLNVIGLSSHMLMIRKNLEAKDAELANMVHREAQRLHAFANDLLMLAKMEDGKLKLNFACVDAKQALRDVEESSQVLAQSKNIKLRLDVPDEARTISVDDHLFQRMVDNLVSNAIKFSPAGGTVTIRLVYTEPGKNSEGIRVEVEDEGPGLAEEQRLKIFNMFETVDLNEESVQQTGVGLAFCKLVAEAHAGKVMVESNKAGGSIFIIEL